VVPKAENGPSEAGASDEPLKMVRSSEAVPEWAGSAPSVGLAAGLKGASARARRNLLLAAGGVGVLVLAVVGIAVFAGGSKKQAPVRLVEKTAASAQPATAQKPAPPAATLELAKLQPVAEAKPAAPATVKPVAAEKAAAPAEKPAAPEKPALAPAAERKVAAGKPAPAERPIAQKPAAAHKPAAGKPAADRPSSELGAPRPEKTQVPAAEPVPNKTQAATEAYQRGNAKLLNGAPAEAIVAFSEALKLNPKDAQSQRGLGMAHAQAGNAAQAVRHLKLYLKASPNAPDRALIQKRIDQLGGR